MQLKSKEAALRMQQRLQETQDVGVTTLEELYGRRRQLEAIEAEANGIHNTLDETEEMQRKLGGWFSFDWLLPSHKTMRQIDANVEQAIGSTVSTCSIDKPANKSKKLWKKFRLGKARTAPLPEEPPRDSKGLCSDEEEPPEEYRNEIEALDKGDKELDHHLDIIGLQLEQLTAMADEIGQETRQQTQKMGKIRDNMIDVHVRQHEAIGKTNKFLGDARMPNNKHESNMLPRPKLI